MTDVHVERARLSDGIPVMYRDYGTRVRLAFDPKQISQPAAIALLCISLPRLIEGFRLLYAVQ